MLFRSADTVVVDTAAVDLGITGITLSKFVIQDAKLIYENRESGIYSKIAKYNFDVLGDLGNDNSRLKFNSSIEGASLLKNNDVLLKDINFSISTYATGNREKDMIVLEDGRVSVNGVKFNSSGFLGRDTINIKANINTGDIQKLIDAIPESILKKNHKFTSRGSMEITANLHGRFRSGRIPIIEGKIKANDISAKYESLKYNLDNLSTNIEYFIDLNSKYKSYVDVKLLRFKSASNTLDIMSYITNPLTSPRFSVNGKARLDLAEISEIVPFNDSVKVSGKVDFDGKVKFDLEKIKKGKYGKTFADAKLNLDSIVIISRSERLNIAYAEAVMSNDKNGYLRVSAKLKEAMLSAEDQIDVKFKQTSVDVEGLEAKDSTAILKFKILCDGLVAKLANDTIGLSLAKFKSEVSIAKQSKSVKLKTDSLLVHYNHHSARLNKAVIDVYTKNKKVYGTLNFSDFVGNVDGMTKPINMQSTELKINNSIVDLTGVKINIGRSNVKLTGRAYNIIEALKKTGKMRINSKLESSFIDISELSNIYNPVENGVESDTTAAMTVFIVPENMVFDFDMNIDSAEYKDINIENIKGKMKLDSSKITLSNISMNALDAELRSAAEYKASDKTSAFSRFVLIADGIDAQNTIKLIPAIDSLLPLIKSLSGVISLSIAADAKLNSKMNIDLNSMEGAIAIHGSKIELKDSKALKEVSDMLMFKKKASSVIDDLGVELIADTGRVEILPFRLSINRYVVAIGGEHFLTNNFKYHISVLKSPVPFKMGINIVGKSLDDWDMKFGKAIYKKENAPTESNLSNPEFVNKWNRLSKGLQYTIQK